MPFKLYSFVFRQFKTYVMATRQVSPLTHFRESSSHLV